LQNCKVYLTVQNITETCNGYHPKKKGNQHITIHIVVKRWRCFI